MGYRHSDTVIKGTNLIVLDIDEGVSINAVKLLLHEYTYLIYTTKRHTESLNRFRVLLPLNYEVSLDASEYKEFMQNVYDWLPFEVDTATGDIARKWSSNKGEHWYNEGNLIDSRLFIPKTNKCDLTKKSVSSYSNLSAIERWFVQNTGQGNRSNQLIKYAYILVDMGLDLTAIQDKVLALNDKLPDKLTESEILKTIIQSVARKTNGTRK